jgi:beta-lactamase class A
VRSLCLLLCLPLCAQPPLDREIAKIAEAAGGTVGVSALHLQSGKVFGLRAAERFPMASVFKLPLAMTILDRNGPGPLEVRMKLEPSDIRPFRSPIAERAPHGGITLTLEELVDATIVESDNTAADVLLHLLPGAGVNAYLHKLGIEGMRVDRSEGQMALDYAGVTGAPPESEWTLDWFKQAMSAVPPNLQREAAQRALADDRDTTTPDAAVKLLRHLVEGKALPKSHTDFLLDLMRKTVPAAARIKAGLPAGTVLAHRPGTGGDNEGVNLCTNDVGIATLPNGNHLLIAVFIKGSNKDLATREQSIAQITRALSDAWSH